jgi:hypothetical protein
MEVRMDELVDLIVEKTGIPKETAEQVVDIVMDFMKDKLPDSIANSLEDLLEGGSAANLLSGLGGLFGGKK